MVMGVPYILWEDIYLLCLKKVGIGLMERKTPLYWPKFCTLPLDLEFLSLVLMLTAIGLVMLLSASYPAALHYKNDALFYFKRQAVFALIGFAAMIFISFLDYEWFRKVGRAFLVFSLFLLMLVLFPSIGEVRNNARRWISISRVPVHRAEYAQMQAQLHINAGQAEQQEIFAPRIPKAMAHGHCRFSSSARALICICHGYIGCFFFEHIGSPVGTFLKSFVEFQLNMTDRELILEQILKKGNGFCKKIRKEFTGHAENSMHQSLSTAALQPASGLQIRTLHLKIVQDTYRHIAKAVLYCTAN